ncbi:replication initiation and membrane attachment family protein [Mesobacillus harenae]|uniref:replication initiation and membrane attachment family protein n=1 Tax=Mesobacillus harenae TaxID=2213203 RepID=UPI001580FDA2|nr:replication initiation and membrane attachment family protein [Mesobacillus harenae]
MAKHWQEILPVDRYRVAINGLLHEYDRKVLTFLYQPLVGTACFSLYMTLWAEVEENRLWSGAASHHGLMNLTDLNLKDIYHARLKLEGIGLLKTFTQTEPEGRSFIYELQPPLSPEQFFLDGMLNIYLYRKIGKNQFLRLKRFFTDQTKIDDGSYKEITRSFQDVYESAPQDALKYDRDTAIDLGAGQDQAFIGRKVSSEIKIDESLFDFDVLLAGLRDSLVPKRALSAKVKGAISTLAFLYGIDALQMKNLVLSALTADNEIEIEELRKAARDWYQFENQDQLPDLLDRLQPMQHKRDRNVPETKEEKLIHYFDTTSPRQLLIDISGGAEASKSDLQIIEDIMFTQKLLPGVVNVLVQYVMLKTDMKLQKGYIEKIASHWARKKIKTVKEAMELAKNEHRQYLDWAEGKKGQSGSQTAPYKQEPLPDWVKKKPSSRKLETDVEGQDTFEEEKRKLDEELKRFKSGK